MSGTLLVEDNEMNRAAHSPAAWSGAATSVAQRGDDIAVASAPGRGSTFTIRLPGEVREPARRVGEP